MKIMDFASTIDPINFNFTAISAHKKGKITNG